MSDHTPERDLEIVRRALVYYGKERNWTPDSWGVRAVHREYGKAGLRARKALIACERLAGSLSHGAPTETERNA